MKKIREILCLAGCLMLVGCSKTSDGEVIMPQVEPIPEPAEAFFGEFTITECAGTSEVYAMSEEEMDGLIGKTVSYQAAAFTNTEGNIIELPQAGYTKETYAVGNFEPDFKVSAQTLGVTQEEVTSVALNTEGEFAGNYFYVLDENTLLIYSEGVFFRAERK